ncbi:MAG TPA: alpha/beta hydrolase family protein [Ruminiclostridium sp.]|nr:alpha/beta hydrolase family protein [Ruminiclostridium sp.]
MAFFEGSIFSESLGVSTSVCVLLPTDTEKTPKSGFPVLYLLHGIFENHTAWLRSTSVDLLAQRYGFAVIMPEAGRSYYTDMKYGLKYFSYISDELPNFCRKSFNISKECGKTFIAGTSMGGYGALKAGLRRPDIFGAFAGLSGAADIKKRADDYKNRPEMRAAFGEPAVLPDDDDLFKLAEKRDNIRHPVLIHCGLSDTRLEENRALYKKLIENGFDVTYKETDGGHDWAYWQRILPDVMEFFLSHL